MKARILTSLLVLGSSVVLLANCSSSDAPVNPPAGGSNNGVAGSAAGTPGSSGGSTPAGGGSGPVGAGGSAGTAVTTGGSGPSGGNGSGVGGSAIGGSTSQGGSGGTSAGGAGGKASGGGSSGGAVGTGGGGSFALTSDKIAAGVKMPTEFTCANKANPPSPPFAWTAGPSGTMSYALIMFDPDAMGGFTHWVVWDIPASTTMLPAALGSMATLTMPAGAKQKAGSGMGYLGPCPPGNATHNYKFTLYALDVATLPGVMTSSTTAALTTAIEMHDIASAVMIVPSDGK